MGSVLRICLDCTAAYSVGAPRCPHCGSERAVDEGTDPYRGGDMPKISVHGGPTDAADIPAEGGDLSSPGDSSSRSETKPSKTPETSSSGGSKRARTTGSRTGRAQTGSSTARSTDTAQTAPTSKTGTDD